MKYLTVSLLLAGSFIALSTIEASAVVCAGGVVRAAASPPAGPPSPRGPVARGVVVAPRGVAVWRRVY